MKKSVSEKLESSPLWPRLVPAVLTAGITITTHWASVASEITLWLRALLALLPLRATLLACSLGSSRGHIKALSLTSIKVDSDFNQN